MSHNLNGRTRNREDDNIKTELKKLSVLCGVDLYGSG
jgi:hypothetical protein